MRSLVYRTSRTLRTSPTNAALLRGALLASTITSAVACVAGSPDDTGLAEEASDELAVGDAPALENRASAEQNAIGSRVEVSPDPLGQTAESPTIVYVPCGGDGDSLHATTSFEGASFAHAESQVIFACADPCVPGSQRGCYDGPAGTDGVGICHAGVQVCFADGGGYGACKGQMVPQPESCATSADEDCNGVGTCAASSTEWVVSLAGNAIAWAVGVDGAGNTLMAGKYTNNVTLAGLPLGNDSYDNGFIAKVDPSGGLMWLRTLGSAASVSVVDAEVDGAGNFIVGGHFYNDLHDGPIQATATGGAADRDSFVVKLDPNGSLLWFKQLGGAQADELLALAVDGNGDTILAMRSSSALTVGSYTHDPALGKGLFEKLDVSGNPVWMRKGPHNVTSMAANASNEIVAGGSYGGTYDFGTGPLTAADFEDAFVVKLGATGGTMWAKRAGGSGQDGTKAVGIDAAGNVFVGGSFNSVMDWGTGLLLPSGTWHDGFITKLDASGNGVWARSFGDGPNVQLVKALDVDAAGNVTIAADCMGTSDLGLGPITAGGYDILLATYAPNGTPTWGGHLYGSWTEVSTAVAVTNGKVVISGNSPYASIDLGTGMIPAGGFVAMIQP